MKMAQTQFEMEVDRIARERGLGYKEAFDVVRKENPGFFRVYVGADDGVIQKFGEDISDLALRISIEQRISFKEALGVVREKYPESWRGYAMRDGG